MPAALIAGRAGAHETVKLNDGLKTKTIPQPEISDTAAQTWAGPDTFYAIKGGELFKLDKDGLWRRYGFAGWVGK